MKIAYEYSFPNSQVLMQLGSDDFGLLDTASCAVIAYDGEEPVGFGFMHKECNEPEACRIRVLPAYGERQIDRNIKKLLQARSGRNARIGAGETLCV
jgi:hypothetical protein